MTRMLWAAPMSPMRKTMKRGATVSSLPISGPPMRARCPPPETAESAHFCCARNVLVNGLNSLLSYARTDYRQVRSSSTNSLWHSYLLLLDANNLPSCSAIRVLRTPAHTWTCCCPSAPSSTLPRTASGSTTSSGLRYLMEMHWCWLCRAKSRPTDGSE